MLSFATSLIIATLDLGKVFAPAEAWKMNAVDFAVAHARDGFGFASEKRDTVNCLGRGKCAWLGLEVWEARVYFGEEGVKAVELSLYNRGDVPTFANRLYQDGMEKLLTEVAERIESGGKLGNPEKKKLPNGAGYRFTRAWPKASPAAQLDWGISGQVKSGEGTVEFVRLKLTPTAGWKPKGAVKAVAGTAAKAKVKANVVKGMGGDVFIDNIPMVDQGKKGYCAAAVAERVLRYYGNEIDEHEFAQRAGTSARSGTDTEDMVESVKRLGSKCHLGYQELVRFSTSLKEVERDIEQFNKAGKEEHLEELKLKDYKRGQVLRIGKLYQDMAEHPQTLRKMRLKDSRYRRFLDGVKTQVDAGVPVIWGVTLGIFPEPGVPQSLGGHMRLIIGYNQKKHEILYSDSWGAGHELKRMPEDWAFTITHSVFFLRPL